MANILFIDDDRVTLKVVKGILESSGYAVITAVNARDGLAELDRHVVDLIITDANMPGGISGFDLVKTVRNDPRYEKIPIAMLTGRRDKRDIQMGVDVGADDYIIKPIDPHILVGKVQSLIKAKPAPSNPANFAEGPVRLPGQYILNVEITHISEKGLSFNTPFPPGLAARTKIHGPFFQQLGIDPPILRVDRQNKIDGTNLYAIQTSFVGMTDNDLQKIRVWINSNARLKTAG